MIYHSCTHSCRYFLVLLISWVFLWIRGDICHCWQVSRFNEVQTTHKCIVSTNRLMKLLHNRRISHVLWSTHTGGWKRQVVLFKAETVLPSSLCYFLNNFFEKILKQNVKVRFATKQLEYYSVTAINLCQSWNSSQNMLLKHSN